MKIPLASFVIVYTFHAYPCVLGLKISTRMLFTSGTGHKFLYKKKMITLQQMMF